MRHQEGPGFSARASQDLRLCGVGTCAELGFLSGCGDRVLSTVGGEQWETT